MYEKSKLIKIILLVAAAVFSALLVVCPSLQLENRIKNLTGRVGVIDNYQLISNLSLPCQQIYIFGDFWCHQISDRSLFINGNQMPLCARCFGTFVGIPFGMLLSIILKVKLEKALHKKVLIVLLIGYTPIFVDSIGQKMGFWSSINPVRVATGALAGASFGIILGVLIDIIGKYVFKEGCKR